MTNDKAVPVEETETEQINIRVTPSMLEAYRDLAKSERRSLSNWIKYVLESVVAQRDSTVASKETP